MLWQLDADMLSVTSGKLGGTTFPAWGATASITAAAKQMPNAIFPLWISFG